MIQLDWPQMQQVLVSLFGILLVISGTRFYRLVVMTPGIVVGIYSGVQLTIGQNEEVQLFAIVLGAVIGAVFSFLVEQLAIALLGALFGGAIVQWLFPIFWNIEIAWYWPVVGAVFGGMIIPPLFPRLLPLLTSIVGAGCLSWAMGRFEDIWLWGALTSFGFFVQRYFGATRPKFDDE